ncbi:MAG TPA: cytochrome c [Acidobacteriaceae bacterium]|nr:cytochrome c [Acidobacteriaceae bacterium]
MLKFLLGVVIGFLLIPVWAYCYLHFGHPPVAVADAAFPYEKQIVRAPLSARIDREMPASAPIQPSLENLKAGAQIYRQQCSACHGLSGHASDFANHMYPHAPQLWNKHRNGSVVGVSDDPVGETYWKVSNGIRLTGMPSYNKVLTDTQMWQVSLLLKQADQPLPADVQSLISTPLPVSTPSK